MDNRFYGYTLNIEIDHHECSNFTKGGAGAVIYFIVENLTENEIEVKLENECIINDKGVQREKDYFYEGYNFTEETIHAHAKKKAGYIYMEKTAGEFSENWKLCLQIIDITNEIEYQAEFVYEGALWKLEKLGIKNGGQICSGKTIAKRCIRNLKRIEDFEEKIGVTLEGINAIVNDSHNSMTIQGEIIALKGNTVNFDFYVKAVVYDMTGHIISVMSQVFYKSQFKGYDTFSLNKQGDYVLADQIRIFTIMR